jgi:calcineurin-like phosphoesterase family protein
MKKWFIADTHFSHTNIIRYAARPYASVEEMNINLIDNWNRSVAIDDQVFFLGDFGLGDVDHLHSICSQLHGNKICIRGNHDRNASWMTRVGFNVVLESAFLKIGRHNVELIHIPTDPAPAHFQFHGHVHDKRPNKIIQNQLNLCVEVWEYKPIAEKTLISLLDKASKQQIQSYEGKVECLPFINFPMNVKMAQILHVYF